VADEPLQMEQLASLVESYRDEHGLSLREAAAEAGVSFNTLARVERGQTPDLTSFRKIVDWLGVPPERFFAPRRRRSESTPALVAQHLLADPDLPDEAATKIASIVEDLYVALVRRDDRLAVHLRAARTFEPEAAEMLATMLTDMQRALTVHEEGGRAPRLQSPR
jgi:transcriptional regulator with XRE-family HTH domain